MTTPLEIFENSVQEKMDQQKAYARFQIGGDLWITDYEKFKEEMQSEINIFIRGCRRLRSRFKLLPVPVVKDGENTGAKYRAIKDQLSKCYTDKFNNIKNVFEKIRNYGTKDRTRRRKKVKHRLRTEVQNSNMIIIMLLAHYIVLVHLECR